MTGRTPKKRRWLTIWQKMRNPVRWKKMLRWMRKNEEMKGEKKQKKQRKLLRQWRRRGMGRWLKKTLRKRMNL